MGMIRSVAHARGIPIRPPASLRRIRRGIALHATLAAMPWIGSCGAITLTARGQVSYFTHIWAQLYEAIAGSTQSGAADDEGGSS